MSLLHIKKTLLFLKKVIHNLTAQTLTIIIVPGAQGKIKQVKLLKSLIFTAIFFFISAGFFLSVSGVILLVKNQDLITVKDYAQSHLRETQVSLKALETLSNEQQQEIETLEFQVKASDDYFIVKISEVKRLEAQLNQLMILISKNQKVGATLIASRSLDLTSPPPLEFNDSSGYLGKYQDSISTEINSQILAYEILTQKLSDSFDQLDATPDLWPAQGEISSPFGMRRDPITRRNAFHKGIDIDADYGTPVSAAGSGIVTFSGWSGEFGQVLVITHGYGYKTLYAHNAKILVSVGDLVQKGQLVAKVGASGKATGPHLHFEIHANNKEINPLKVLQP